MTRCTSKVALVTGGRSGIARARQLDVLVNNSGMIQEAGVEDMSLATGTAH